MGIKWENISICDDYTIPILGYIGHIWLWYDTVDHTVGWKFQINNLETYIFNVKTREEAEEKAGKIFTGFLEKLDENNQGNGD